MRALSEFSGVYLHKEPVDMRKSINGLSEIVEFEKMGALMGPNLFVFMGKRRHLIKVLYFDRSGFCLWTKRLEQERFCWPKKSTSDVVQLTAEQFGWLLDGFDITKMKPFKALFFEKVS